MKSSGVDAGEGADGYSMETDSEGASRPSQNQSDIPNRDQGVPPNTQLPNYSSPAAAPTSTGESPSFLSVGLEGHGFSQSVHSPWLDAGSRPVGSAYRLATLGQVSVKPTPTNYHPFWNASPTPSMRPYGWDKKKRQIAKPTPRFPQNIILERLPLPQLDSALDRVQLFFQQSSIQAEFENNPVAAKLQTADGVEFWFKVWEDTKDDKFYVDIQWQRGDQFRFKHIVNDLLTIMRSEDDDVVAKMKSPTPMDIALQQIQPIVNVVQQLSPPTPDDMRMMEMAISSIHLGLTNQQFGARKAALEDLLSLTDLRRTMSAAAIPAASIVLCADAFDMAVKLNLTGECAEIQGVLFRVLHQQDFEGDEELRRILSKVSGGMGTFMPVVHRSDEEYPPQYVDAMSEIFQMVLKLLDNCFDVLRCFPGAFSKGTLHQFWMTYRENTEQSIEETLVGCISRADRQLSEAYLACRVLRKLLMGYPPLKLQLQKDSRTAQYVTHARETGRRCHALLEKECGELIRAVTTNT